MTRVHHNKDLGYFFVRVCLVKSRGGCCERDNGNASPWRPGEAAAGLCGVIRLVRSDAGSWGDAGLACATSHTPPVSSTAAASSSSPTPPSSSTYSLFLFSSSSSPSPPRVIFLFFVSTFGTTLSDGFVRTQVITLDSDAPPSHSRNRPTFLCAVGKKSLNCLHWNHGKWKSLSRHKKYAGVSVVHQHRNNQFFNILLYS